ncbi:MAG TPA: hypothetical protein PKA74_12545 [Bauldia sp.]|nr:hypothetical protein [Bauldia sp.]
MSDANQTDDGSRGPGAWIAALILIGVGVVFLFQNLGYAVPGNWWALFILIPAVFAFGHAWRLYTAAGGFTGAMTGPLITGVVLVALTVMFLLDLDVNWNLVWPIVLILIGVAALARGLARR